MRKSFNLLLLTLSFVLLVFDPPGSLSQESGSLIPIIAESDLIVVGEVVSKEAKWADGIRTIDTYITISVEEYIKGSSPSKDIILRYPGGRIEEENIKLIALAPRPLFNLKEKVIVMLRLLPDQKHYILTDTEGKLSIDARGKVIGPGTTKQDFIRMIKDIMASQKQQIEIHLFFCRPKHSTIIFSTTIGPARQMLNPIEGGMIMAFENTLVCTGELAD